MVLVVHFESEIDRLVYQLFGLTNEKPTVAVCYPRKTLINSLMPTVAIRDTSHDIRALPHDIGNKVANRKISAFFLLY